MVMGKTDICWSCILYAKHFFLHFLIFSRTTTIWERYQTFPISQQMNSGSERVNKFSRATYLVRGKNGVPALALQQCTQQPAFLLEDGLPGLEKCPDHIPCYCDPTETHLTTPLGDEDDRGDEIPPFCWETLALGHICWLKECSSGRSSDF